MTVSELCDNLTLLCHEGYAFEEIVVIIDGNEYKIEKAVNDNGEFKLIVSNKEYNELM